VARSLGVLSVKRQLCAAGTIDSLDRRLHSAEVIPTKLLPAPVHVPSPALAVSDTIPIYALLIEPFSEFFWRSRAPKGLALRDHFSQGFKFC
jgi:hypothetical protein